MKKMLAAVSEVFALLLLGGCMIVNVDKGAGESSERQKITMSGSTSMEDLMNALGAAYSKSKPDVVVEVQSGGSSVGVSNAKDGISDIGESSRDLKAGEKEYGLTETVVAIDGIAVAVNPENPVRELSKGQLSGIFSGKITNWNEIGGKNAPIVTIGREAGSGTRDGFEELLGIKGKSVYTIEAGETGLVKMKVGLEKNAIGYLSLGKTDENVRVLSVDGVRPSEHTVKNGEYPLQRNFLCLTSKNTSQKARDFLLYCLSSEGQEIVGKSGYTRIQG